jgi:hypothetical protein
LCQQPFPNCHNCWNIIQAIQNIHSNMTLTKLIIKNYFPWITSYDMATCNEQPNIIHKFTFRTLLNKPTFWWDAEVHSFIFIINSFLLFFTISSLICVFTHRIRKTLFKMSSLVTS